VTRVEVRRTYLELRSPADFVAVSTPPDPGVITELRPCPVDVSRRLYLEVGSRYHWRDRLALSDAELAAYLAQPEVRTFVLGDDQGTARGFYELRKHPDGSVEVSLFGLVAGAQGRGRGKWLLQSAVHEAWTWGATRVWLHTCTLDSPVALPNYRARGFTEYRVETYAYEIPGPGDAA
jgi:GNAT superfamily N-acetyltransferase